MSAAQFKLDMFEGPLDLLLHLISKHKLNIYDIEISLLLEQYMDYINNLDHEDYEDAADFLEMAARLIYIKTCSLLPHDDEAKELKKELEGRIIEYSLCKLAAQTLRESYAGDLLFVRSPLKLPVDKTYSRIHEPQSLYDSYMGISKKARQSVPLKAKMFEPIVSHKIVSVTSKIIYVLKRLYHSGECDMGNLYDGMTDKSEKVATFLAILELTKSGRIFLNDDNSKIFFNKASKNRKIESDFDKPVQQEESVEDNNADNAENEEVKSLDDIEIDTQADESDKSEVTDEEDIDKLYQKPTYEEIRKPVASRSERISSNYITAYAPMDDKVEEVSAKAVDEETAIDEVSESADAIIDEDIKTEVVQPIEIEDDEHNEVISAEALYEIELMKQLADITPYTTFKPNYWSRRRYYWGYSPVGDDDMKNYWRYG